VIRAVDSKHILWLDGNTFAMEWKFFEPLVSGPTRLRNCAYSLHDYSSLGFPSGEAFVWSDELRAKLERQFLRKTEFMHIHKVVAWNGEFGPVYEDPRVVGREVAEGVNAQRYGLLGEQLGIYERYGFSWSIWLYKDIGLQGMVRVDPESRYLRTIEPFLEKKSVAQRDAWGNYPSKRVEDVLKPFVVSYYFYTFRVD
jgi:hypothetical protein